jgi:hypothetical protein
MLLEKPDGRRKIKAPSAFGQAVVTFAPELAEQLTHAASAALQEASAHDRRPA